MSKAISITTEALRMILNKNYNMNLPEEPKFILEKESIKVKGLNYKVLKECKDKRDFAIFELTKVRKFVDGRTYLAQYIDQRIKELKENK